MIAREQWREREERWRKFHELEDAQPLPERPVEEILGDLDI